LYIEVFFFLAAGFFVASSAVSDFALVVFIVYEFRVSSRYIDEFLVLILIYIASFVVSIF
jgi:hypothetical protein